MCDTTQTTAFVVVQIYEVGDVYCWNAGCDRLRLAGLLLLPAFSRRTPASLPQSCPPEQRSRIHFEMFTLLA